MTLMNKDGKPYRTFSAPNPLVAEQITVDKQELVFHNFKQKTTVEEIPDLPKPIKSEIPKPQTAAVDDFLSLLKTEAKNLKATPPPELPKPPKPKDVMEGEGVVVVFCQPATIRETTDDLYGETRRTIKYGEKFDFDALIADMSDLEICLFTRQKIDIGSVVYPSRYKFKTDEGGLQLLRWWRIGQIQPYKDGFLLYGNITNHNVDFS